MQIRPFSRERTRRQIASVVHLLGGAMLLSPQSRLLDRLLDAIRYVATGRTGYISPGYLSHMQIELQFFEPETRSRIMAKLADGRIMEASEDALHSAHDEARDAPEVTSKAA